MALMVGKLYCQYRRHKRHGFDPCVGRSCRGGHDPLSSILAWRIPGNGNVCFPFPLHYCGFCLFDMMVFPHPPNNILHEMSSYKTACYSSIRSGGLNSGVWPLWSFRTWAILPLGSRIGKLLTYANWKLKFSLRCDFKNVSLWSNQRAKWGESEVWPRVTFLFCLVHYGIYFYQTYFAFYFRYGTVHALSINPGFQCN